MSPSSGFVTGFVDPAIGAAADEAYYIVVVVYPPLTSVSHRRHLGIGRLWKCRCQLIVVILIEEAVGIERKVPLKTEWRLRLRVRLPPGTEEVAFLTLGAELGGLMVGAAEAVTEGGTFERAEVEVIMARD